MPDPLIVAEWVGLGFMHGCALYGAVFGVTAVLSLLK